MHHINASLAHRKKIRAFSATYICKIKNSYVIAVLIGTNGNVKKLLNSRIRYNYMNEYFIPCPPIDKVCIIPSAGISCKAP